MAAKLAVLRLAVPMPRRKTAALRCAVVAAVFLVFFLFHITVVSPPPLPLPPPPTTTTTTTTTNPDTIPTSDGQSSRLPEDSLPGKARPSKLGDAVMELLERYRPSETVPDWTTERYDAQLWHWGEPDPVNVTDKLTLNDTELATIKKAHQGFVDAVHARLPEYVPHRYGNRSSWTGDDDNDNDNDNDDNSASPKRGIVIVGGGKFNVILAVSLRMLRRTGTTLPVEVFVTEGEYEKDVCEHILPTLHAACRVYPLMPMPIQHGFQLKAFALLFSSFDEVLFLDADNTAMRNVAPLFASPPFRETGLVTWPDFWQTTVSPLYYAIAGTAPVPVAARPATESGQILVDKVRHWKTLLLAVYYNYHGPDFYYRLLNQGFTGMGDKETFLPAAAVFGLPFYQVHAPVAKAGHRFEDGSVGGRVMVQYDASADWAVTQSLAQDTDTDTDTDTEQAWKEAYRARVQPVFLHVNWPKWDPTDLLSHVSKWSDMTIGVSGQPEAAFSYPPDVAAQLRGTERMLWEEATWLACHMRTRFRHWRNNGKAVHTCEKLERHFERVFDTDVGRALGIGPDDALYPKLPDDV